MSLSAAGPVGPGLSPHAGDVPTPSVAELRLQLRNLLHCTQEQLLTSSGRDWPQQTARTSSVSYVVRSESTQHGAAHAYGPLPHVAIRPPGLQALPPGCPRVAQLADQLENQPTCLAVLPWRTEHCVRPYLLEAGRRGQLLAAAGSALRPGKVLRDVRCELRRDRTFLLLHYRWDGARLWPCGPPPGGEGAPNQGGDQPSAGQHLDGNVGRAVAAGGPEGSSGAAGAGPVGQEQGQQPEQQQSGARTQRGLSHEDRSRGEGELPGVGPGAGAAGLVAGLGAAGCEATGAAQPLQSVEGGADRSAVRQRHYTILDSNVQLGILVRKGVGGTYPFQTACKQLADRGLLPGIPKRGKGGNNGRGGEGTQGSGTGGGGGENCGGGAGEAAPGCGSTASAGATAAVAAAVVATSALGSSGGPGEEVQRQGQGVDGQVQAGLGRTGATAGVADTHSASISGYEGGSPVEQLQLGPGGEPSAACTTTQSAAGAGPAGAPAMDAPSDVGMSAVLGLPSAPAETLCPDPPAGRCSALGAAFEGSQAAHSSLSLKRTAEAAFGVVAPDGGMGGARGSREGAAAATGQSVGSGGNTFGPDAEVTQLSGGEAAVPQPLPTPTPTTGVDTAPAPKPAVAFACTPNSHTTSSSIPTSAHTLFPYSPSATAPVSVTTPASVPAFASEPTSSAPTRTPSSIPTSAPSSCSIPAAAPASALTVPAPSSASASTAVFAPATTDPTSKPASPPTPAPALAPASATSPAPAPAPASTPTPSPPVPAHHVPLLKSIGAGAVPLYAHCCRLELYVAQDTWHEAPKPDRNLLYSAVQEVERRLHAAFNDWNHAALARHVAGLVRRLDAGQRDCGGGSAGSSNDSSSTGGCDQRGAGERGGGGVGSAGPDPCAGGGRDVQAASAAVAAAAAAGAAGAAGTGAAPSAAQSSLVAAAAAVLAAAAAAYAKHSAAAPPAINGGIIATAAVCTARPTAAAAATFNGAAAESTAAPRPADGADGVGAAAVPLLEGAEGPVAAAGSLHGAGAAIAAAEVTAGGACAARCAGPPTGEEVPAPGQQSENVPEGCSTSGSSIRTKASAFGAPPAAPAEATAAPAAHAAATSATSATLTAAAPAAIAAPAALPVASAAVQPAAAQSAAVQCAVTPPAALQCAALQPALQAALNAFLASPTFRAVVAAAAANRQPSTATSNGQAQAQGQWHQLRGCIAPRVAHIPGGVPALFSVAAACATLAETVLQLTPMFSPDACNKSGNLSSSNSRNGSNGSSGSSAHGDDCSGNPDGVSGFPWPLYLVSTRDSFTYHLVPRTTVVHAPDGRTLQRTEYFFREGELPPDYWLFAGKPTAEVFRDDAPTVGADAPAAAAVVARPVAAGDAAAAAVTTASAASRDKGLATADAAPTAADTLCAADSDPGSVAGQQRDEELEALRAIADVLGGLVDSLGSRDHGGLDCGNRDADGVKEGGADAPSTCRISHQGRIGSGDVGQGAEAGKGKVFGAKDVGRAGNKEQVESVTGSGDGSPGTGEPAAADEGGGHSNTRGGSVPSVCAPCCGPEAGRGAARNKDNAAGIHGCVDGGGGGDGGGNSAGGPGGELQNSAEEQAAGNTFERKRNGEAADGQAGATTTATAHTPATAAAIATATSSTPGLEAMAAAGSAAPPSPALLFPPVDPPPPGLLPVGVVTYNQLFGDGELSRMEAEADATDVLARQGQLPPGCVHATAGKSGLLKRTKLFFGARYLWTREQLSSPTARVAGGVRLDVPPPLRWMRHQAEDALVASGVIPRGFVDSIALNLYHDGSEGIQSHYDDAARFRRPIYSVRLFSDSRLSFGGRLYGTTNNDFFVPMPRGCVTVLEDDSFAANGIKHCVRPADMAGKSAALILRKIDPRAMAEARELLLSDTCRQLTRALRIVEGPTGPGAAGGAGGERAETGPGAYGAPGRNPGLPGRGRDPRRPAGTAAAGAGAGAARALHLRAPAKLSDAEVASAVGRVVESLVDRVERVVRRQQVVESAVSSVLSRMVWAVSRAAAREQLYGDGEGEGEGEGEGHLHHLPHGAHGAAGRAGWRVGGRGAGRAAGVYGMYGRAGRPDLTLGYEERQVRGVMNRMLLGVESAVRAERITWSVRHVMDCMINRLERQLEGRRGQGRSAVAAGDAMAGGRAAGRGRRQGAIMPGASGSSAVGRGSGVGAGGVAGRGGVRVGGAAAPRFASGAALMPSRRRAVRACHQQQQQQQQQQLLLQQHEGGEGGFLGIPVQGTGQQPGAEATGCGSGSGCTALEAADGPGEGAAGPAQRQPSVAGDVPDSSGAGAGGDALSAVSTAAAATATAGPAPFAPGMGGRRMVSGRGRGRGRRGRQVGHGLEGTGEVQVPPARRRRMQGPGPFFASQDTQGAPTAAAAAAGCSKQYDKSYYEAAADDLTAAADGDADAAAAAAVAEQWSSRRWSEPRVLRAATRLALAGAEAGGPDIRRAVRDLLRVEGFRILRWMRQQREVFVASAAALGKRSGEGGSGRSGGAVGGQRVGGGVASGASGSAPERQYAVRVSQYVRPQGETPQLPYRTFTAMLQAAMQGDVEEGVREEGQGRDEGVRVVEAGGVQQRGLQHGEEGALGIRGAGEPGGSEAGGSYVAGVGWGSVWMPMHASTAVGVPSPVNPGHGQQRRQQQGQGQQRVEGDMAGCAPVRAGVGDAAHAEAPQPPSALTPAGTVPGERASGTGVVAGAVPHPAASAACPALSQTGPSASVPSLWRRVYDDSVDAVLSRAAVMDGKHPGRPEVRPVQGTDHQGCLGVGGSQASSCSVTHKRDRHESEEGEGEAECSMRCKRRVQGPATVGKGIGKGEVMDEDEGYWDPLAAVGPVQLLAHAVLSHVLAAAAEAAAAEARSVGAAAEEEVAEAEADAYEAVAAASKAETKGLGRSVGCVELGSSGLATGHGAVAGVGPAQRSRGRKRRVAVAAPSGHDSGIAEGSVVAPAASEGPASAMETRVPVGRVGAVGAAGHAQQQVTAGAPGAVRGGDGAGEADVAGAAVTEEVMAGGAMCGDDAAPAGVGAATAAVAQGCAAGPEEGQQRAGMCGAGAVAARAPAASAPTAHDESLKAPTHPPAGDGQRTPPSHGTPRAPAAPVPAAASEPPQAMFAPPMPRTPCKAPPSVTATTTTAAAATAFRTGCTASSSAPPLGATSTPSCTANAMHTPPRNVPAPVAASASTASVSPTPPRAGSQVLRGAAPGPAPTSKPGPSSPRAPWSMAAALARRGLGGSGSNGVRNSLSSGNSGSGNNSNSTRGAGAGAGAVAAPSPRAAASPFAAPAASPFAAASSSRQGPATAAMGLPSTRSNSGSTNVPNTPHDLPTANPASLHGAAANPLLKAVSLPQPQTWTPLRRADTTASLAGPLPRHAPPSSTPAASAALSAPQPLPSHASSSAPPATPATPRQHPAAAAASDAPLAPATPCAPHRTASFQPLSPLTLSTAQATPAPASTCTDTASGLSSAHSLPLPDAPRHQTTTLPSTTPPSRVAQPPTNPTSRHREAGSSGAGMEAAVGCAAAKAGPAVVEGGGAGSRRRQRSVSSLPLVVCMVCFQGLPEQEQAEGCQLEAGPAQPRSDTAPSISVGFSGGRGGGAGTGGGGGDGSPGAGAGARSSVWWSCEGPCRRAFHTACAQPARPDKYEQAKTICEACLHDAHPCFACGGAAPSDPTAPGLVKCGLAACGRFYHAACVQAHPLARPASGGRRLRCPLHTCALCSGGGEGAAMQGCAHCPTAFHARCRPPGAELLARKLLVCPACVAAGKHQA